MNFQLHIHSVRGYLPVTSDARRNLVDLNVEQESIRELAQRKNNLELELKNYAENQAVQVINPTDFFGIRHAAKTKYSRNSGAAAWPDHC